MNDKQFTNKEASDFGWKPGEWPKKFEHNGCSYEWASKGVRNGELECVYYLPTSFPKRKMMKVYND